MLVSGASFAGLATAFWMDRLGCQVTVIEVADGLRRGGTPVDIEGGALDAVRRMGVLDAMRGKALPPRRLEFKTADDATVGVLSNPGDPGEKFEIDRDDLLDILFRGVEERADFRFGTSTTELDSDSDGVNVVFSNGSRRRFDLVFGCDGNRSNTRRLAFPDAEGCSYFMGGSVALVGAAALADAFERHGPDHAAAFRDYETNLRPVVEPVQREAADIGMAMLLPKDEAAIAERDRRLREGAFGR